ncbi:aminodeoxychorismate synthase component I [Tamilnaduibacter salinus]|uniref:aminodeoxychorismate synthase component I n=1 Tax=Tamilnaduibacter salinus TaxID=1484056 RepID=UPI00130435A0|nr:aminodeoxychorismate synthase component I [Tamilnaduibacter salinus]
MQSATEHHPISVEQLALWEDALSRESGFINGFHPNGRFLTAHPDRCWTIESNGELARSQIREAIDWHQQYRSEQGETAFLGGLAGVLHYELGGITVPGFQSRRPDADESRGWIGAYSWALDISVDRAPTLTIQPFCPEPTRRWLMSLLERGPQAASPSPLALSAPFQADESGDQYQQQVGHLLDWIHAGDCYQANLSRRHSAHFTGSPYDGFRRLMGAIPVPFGAYIDTGRRQVLSISPERFLRIDGSQVESKPIKGTRPRGATPGDDQALAEALRTHPKDRAENLMIVDLIRNDLSRFCEPHSVRVPRLFDVESYENVHQLVSTVTGTLREDVTLLDALLSAFPGGSITGAPKRRAMEIIDELEDHRRGPYCGSVFFWNLSDHLDSNIAIRTLETESSSGEIRCWGGCGIVADSDPAEELAEAETKVRRLMETLENG